MTNQIKIIVVLLIAFTAAFPASGLSESKSAWLQAGPLSDTPANIQKKAALAEKKKALAAKKKVVPEEPKKVKKEPFSLKRWVRKNFG